MTKERSVILIPYYKDNDVVHALMQQRSAHAHRLPGFVSFFGGGIENTETSAQTLIREIKEELGLDISTLPYTFFCHYEFFGRIVDVYILEIEKSVAHSLSDHEGDGVVFVTEDSSNTCKINLPDQVILKNFFGAIVHNNPYK